MNAKLSSSTYFEAHYEATQLSMVVREGNVEEEPDVVVCVSVSQARTRHVSRCLSDFEADMPGYPGFCA
jgi:hypothetical protein